jgi:purine-binding chemotaxis protein CheW
VIDCRVALGFAPSELAEGARAAVVHWEGHAYALLVDEAYDVDEARSELRQVPGGFGSEWQHAATGMVETAEGPALIIDLAQLVGGPVAHAA